MSNLSNLLSLPRELIHTHLIPYIVEEETKTEKMTFNSALALKAKKILSFFLTCKTFYALPRPHAFIQLKTQYFQNLENAKDVEIPPQNEEPSLHFLARTKRYTDFMTLLLSEVDINKKNAQGVTVLHLAVKQELLDFVELLLKHPKIDIDIPFGKNKKCALEMTNQPEVQQLFHAYIERAELKLPRSFPS